MESEAGIAFIEYILGQGTFADVTANVDDIDAVPYQSYDYAYRPTWPWSLLSILHCFRYDPKDRR